MPAMPAAATQRLGDAINSGMETTRRIVDTQVMPRAKPAGAKAAAQLRETMQQHVVPAAAAAYENAVVAYENALTASEPARKEAVRRSMLAADVLRTGTPGGKAVTRSRTRWSLVLLALMLGAGIGAVVTWFTQAGKPTDMAPYPLPSDADGNAPDLIDIADIADEEPVEHPS